MSSRATKEVRAYGWTVLSVSVYAVDRKRLEWLSKRTKQNMSATIREALVVYEAFLDEELAEMETPK